MASTDNKNLLEILAVNTHNGVSKKTQQPFSLPKAQCVLRSGDGTLRVGELILSKDLAETKAGKYIAAFELDVDYNGKVVPRVTALHPFAAMSAAPAKA